MTDLAMLDKAFHTIMRSLIETGWAPHYAERFSNEMMRNRGRPDFISWYTDWRLARAQQR